MTKEEFIAIAQQSSDRVDMLSKMGHQFSKENVETYIKIPRLAFGISVEEMVGYFSQPSMSKEIYLSYISGSSNKIEALDKMGYPSTQENVIKYIVDPARKFGLSYEHMAENWNKSLASASFVTGSNV